MTKSLLKYHLLGFSIVLVSLLGLVVYQLFVTPKFTRIPLRQFFKTSTLSQLFYRTPDIGQFQNFPNPNPMAVMCEPDCYFFFQERIVMAKVDNDENKRFTDFSQFEPKFLDDQAGLIGYQTTDLSNPTFYVINYSGQLLQTIRLNLNQYRLLEFINYYPKTKEIMFKSTHQDTQIEKIWLYTATTPSLRQINL
ncbi:MAG: hypothetical protein ABII08_03590 [Candidatus Beckwithbacteria bacterium]